MRQKAGLGELGAFKMTVFIISCIVFAFLLIAYLGWALVRMGRYEIPDPPEDKNGWSGFLGE